MRITLTHECRLLFTRIDVKKEGIMSINLSFILNYLLYMDIIFQISFILYNFAAYMIIINQLTWKR